MLGEEDPEKLVKTVLFLTGGNFALRWGDKHKRLRRPGCDPQIINYADDDGVECLKFTDDPYSKTNQGGLGKKLAEPKVIYCYKHKDPRRCLYRLYNKYVSLIPQTTKAKCLYLRAKHRPTPKQWYINSQLGINSIRPVINEMCELIGLPKANWSSDNSEDLW